MTKCRQEHDEDPRSERVGFPAEPASAVHAVAPVALHGGSPRRETLLFSGRSAKRADLTRTAEVPSREALQRDKLTQLFNRSYFDERLRSEIACARRSRGSLTLLMVDVDRLQRLNGAFGHLAGDRALFVIASQLARAVRLDDVVARYADDTFAIIARQADLDETTALGERVRHCVEALPFRAAGRRMRLTISVGISSLVGVEVGPREDPSADLTALAERHVYEAKRRGGNRIVA